MLPGLADQILLGAFLQRDQEVDLLVEPPGRGPSSGRELLLP